MRLVLLCAVAFLPSVVEPATPLWRSQDSAADLFSVADINPTPDAILELSFDDVEITPGQEICPSDAVPVPTVGFEYEVGCYYTLLILDRDLPSPSYPLLSLFLMGLYVNLYGDASRGMVIEDSSEIAAWFPPSPPPHTGLHRYVAYVYKQEGLVDKSDEELRRLNYRRTAFNLDGFVARYRFSGPVAGSFFLAQYPERRQ